MKGTTREYLAVLLACSLLLSTFSVPARAGCEPPCDDCEECDIEDCECVWEGCPSCGRCRYCDSSCDCQWVGNCRYDSDCPDCHTCPTPECNCEYQCNPDNCQTCVNGSCQVCGGDPDKCCDNGTCVDKCTNTGQCDYGELPSGPYANCQALQDPVTGQCGPAEGFICNHLATIAENDAECADCAPGCDKTRICACAQIVPIHCKTHCYLLFCQCLCDDAGEPYYIGDHYECD